MNYSFSSVNLKGTIAELVASFAMNLSKIVKFVFNGRSRRRAQTALLWGRFQPEKLASTSILSQRTVSKVVPWARLGSLARLWSLTWISCFSCNQRRHANDVTTTNCRHQCPQYQHQHQPETGHQGLALTPASGQKSIKSRRKPGRRRLCRVC